VLRQSEAFQAQQADIDRRLLIVTRSETGDEAARKFESSMEKLRGLDIAKGYIELLKEVEELRCGYNSQAGHCWHCTNIDSL